MGYNSTITLPFLEGCLVADKLFTTNEAAARLGIQPRTVTRYILRGLIFAEKLGRDWLITEEELKRFEADRRNVGRPQKAE